MMDSFKVQFIASAALTLALAAWMGRYEIEPAGQSVEFVYRLDRWTGQVEVVDLSAGLQELEEQWAMRKRGMRP